MDSARCGGPYERIPPAQGTNQIAGFVEFRPLTSRNRDEAFYYIDTCVLLENIPLVKFTKSTFGARVVYFP